MKRPAFGDYLRAARTGFAWDERRGAFLRFSDLAPGKYLVEAASPGHLPASGHGLHRAWWEGPEEVRERFLSACAPLATLGELDGNRSWVVGDDGHEVPR